MPRALLAAEEHVLDDVEVVAEREVLVDDLDAERGGVARAVDGDRLALEQNSPGVDGVDPADALDQSGLAGAVVADERGDLAGVDGEVDVVQHLDGAEALVDARAAPAAGSLSHGWSPFRQGVRRLAPVERCAACAGRPCGASRSGAGPRRAVAVAQLMPASVQAWRRSRRCRARPS